MIALYWFPIVATAPLQENHHWVRNRITEVCTSKTKNSPSSKKVEKLETTNSRVTEIILSQTLLPL